MFRTHGAISKQELQNIACVLMNAKMKMSAHVLNHVTILTDLLAILYYLYICFRTVLTTCKTGRKVEGHKEEQVDVMFKRIHFSEDLFDL